MKRDGDRLQLATQLTISRPSGGGLGAPYISIRVEDHASRTTIVELDVALDEFAMALTGRANVECSGVVWPTGLARLGLVRENESRTLVVDSASAMPDDVWGSLVWREWQRQFPEDGPNGWSIFGLDKRPNPHRRGRTESGEQTYQIAVERYVEPEPSS